MSTVFIFGNVLAISPTPSIPCLPSPLSSFYPLPSFPTLLLLSLAFFPHSPPSIPCLPSPLSSFYPLPSFPTLLLLSLAFLPHSPPSIPCLPSPLSSFYPLPSFPTLLLLSLAFLPHSPPSIPCLPSPLSSLSPARQIFLPPILSFQSLSFPHTLHSEVIQPLSASQTAAFLQSPVEIE